MSSVTKTRLVPSGVPFSAAEQAEWDALTDQERLQVWNEMLDSPDCNTLVDDTVEQIRDAAKARLKAERG